MHFVLTVRLEPKKSPTKKIEMMPTATTMYNTFEALSVVLEPAHGKKN